MITKQLYVLASNINRVKIGISSDAHARMAQISAGSPIAIQLYVAFAKRVETKRARQIERDLHWRFAKFRLHGEWFSISVAEAVEAAKEASNQYAEEKNEFRQLPRLPNDRVYWTVPRATLCEVE